MAYNSETDKIDKKATDGLAGISNSLAYRVHEIEKHFHNRERWIGEHTTRNAEVDCGETGRLVPFQATAGNNTWGTPLCILGTTDTPVIAAQTKFDIHRIMIIDVAVAANVISHYIQIIYGTGTAADAITAGQFSEIIVTPERAGKAEPFDIMMPRVTAGQKAWVRHWVKSVNAPTMDFYIGLHEYAG
jgi:hypothetical protein